MKPGCERTVRVVRRSEATRRALLGTVVLAAGLMPGATAWAAGGDGSSSDYVPRAEYEQLKSRFDTLEHRVDGRGSAGERAAPGGQPLRGMNGDLGASLFGPKTEEEYFCPLDQMNPALIRSATSLELGQLDDMHLFIGVDTVGRVQFLDQYHASAGGKSLGGLNSGFQTTWGNLSFRAAIPDKVEVYFDLYIASRPHASQTYGHEGFMLFYEAPGSLNDIELLRRAFEVIDVKVGAFDIDFGEQNYRRSNNARAQKNPLIGNFLVDPNGEEIGGEVYTTTLPVNWLVGLGSGKTTEHFSSGGGLSVHGKVWVVPVESVRTSCSIYWVDHSDNAADNTTLFSSNRSGGPYAAIFGGGDSPGQIVPQKGRNMMAVQGDVICLAWPVEAYANVGWTGDRDINGSVPGRPREAWYYGVAEVVYHVTSELYGAARYSVAFADDIAGVSSNGWVDRIQVGGGYWLTRTILSKVEYVYERYHHFNAAAGTVSGVDAALSPGFSGVMFEVSFTF